MTHAYLWASSEREKPYTFSFNVRGSTDLVEDGAKGEPTTSLCSALSFSVRFPLMLSSASISLLDDSWYLWKNENNLADFSN